MASHTTRHPIAVALILLAGCEGTAPEPACRVIEHHGTRIDETGGTLRFNGDDAVLTIPAGAVTQECGIVVSIEPWTDLYSHAPWLGGARALFGTSYHVRAFDASAHPEEVRLAVPATLTIRYDAAGVPAGVAAEELVLAQVTRVGCSPDLIGFGCSWDLAYRPLSTSSADVGANRLTASLSCLDVCGGRSDGIGNGTGEFLIMHPRCERYGGDPADPQWQCDAP